MKTTKYEIACFSDCGKVRLQNEDSYLLRQQESTQGTILLSGCGGWYGRFGKRTAGQPNVDASFREWWAA